MKQFSLEEFLKNPKRKIVTRNGCPVRIICMDRKSASNSPIIALVTYDSENGYEQCYTYTPNGVAFPGDESDIDLFFAPIKHVDWVNVYRTEDGDYSYGGEVYDTEQKAKESISNDENYITTTKIEWEE